MAIQGGVGLRAEHADETRRELVRAARALLAERGYAATAVRDIADEARVTKGALYHHFGDKRGIFRAVHEAVEADLAKNIVEAAAAERSAAARLRRGSAAYLDACLEEPVRRILLLDGPSVLGWEEWRAIEARHVLGMITAVLDEMVSAHELDTDDTGTLAHVLLAALNEAAMIIAHASEPERARRRAGKTIETLLSRLTAEPATD